MQETGHHHVGRQTRPMQEKEQGNGEIGRKPNHSAGLPDIGRIEASATMATSSIVKVSGMKRFI